MLPDTFTPKLLQQLELLRLRTRRSFLGARQGGHLSPKRGHGMEFSEYRRYELGDNPRNIDWGVYARTEKLYVKRFQEEQDRTLLLMVDSSSSMFAVDGGVKWRFARDIAIALAYVALMEQDNVVIAVPGHGRTPRLSGARAIHSVSAFLASVRAGERTSEQMVEDLNRAVLATRLPGASIFVSDLLFSHIHLANLLRATRARNFESSVIQVLAPTDEEPLPLGSSIAIDSETGEQVEVNFTEREQAEYRYLLDQHNDQLKALCAQSKVTYVRSSTTLSLQQFITQQLVRVGLLA